MAVSMEIPARPDAAFKPISTKCAVAAPRAAHTAAPDASTEAVKHGPRGPHPDALLALFGHLAEGRTTSPARYLSSAADQSRSSHLPQPIEPKPVVPKPAETQPAVPEPDRPSGRCEDLPPRPYPQSCY